MTNEPPAASSTASDSPSDTSGSLREHLLERLERRCCTTWSALSAARHYRTYELAPTPVEIGTQLLEVPALLTALRDEPDTTPAAQDTGS
ncbi:hypothetical protein ACFY2M_44955 [Streptomyces sp. NPDC001276]|uniref:hypothetical protein n=1 Tax=Streptomyces sp. NPDC001276 TaxID=3364555 RepID=UPI0036A8B260